MDDFHEGLGNAKFEKQVVVLLGFVIGGITSRAHGFITAQDEHAARDRRLDRFSQEILTLGAMDSGRMLRSEYDRLPGRRHQFLKFGGHRFKGRLRSDSPFGELFSFRAAFHGLAH